MIKNFIIVLCIFIIMSCLFRIHRLNVFINAYMVPNKQLPMSYNAMCVRVVNKKLLNEFISYHMTQGFLTFTFYGDDVYTDIEYVFSELGIVMQFKPIVENVEWDCLLDSVINPSISNVVLLNNDNFVFPLENKHTSIHGSGKCDIFEEFNFIEDVDNGNLITQNTKRDMHTLINSKNSIFSIGKTSKERVNLLRNYSSSTLYDGCTMSKTHGIAKFNSNHTDRLVTDYRLRDFHSVVTLGRRTINLKKNE